MPPEQASGETGTIGPAADIYSLGAILYALLTGRPPFQSANVMDTLVAVLEQEPVAPRQLNPALDVDLETICLKCLEKDAGRRYATAGDLVDELGRYLNGEPIHARPIGKLERGWRWCKRKPALAGLSALAVVMLLTLGIGGPLVALQQAENARQQTKLRGQADAERTKAEEERKQADQQRVKSEQAQVALADEKERSIARVYATTTALAHQKWLANDVAAAEKLLDSTPTEFREWEFGYLKNILHADRMTLRGHEGAVSELRYCGDGKRLVSIDRQGQVHVWDLNTGSIIRTRKARSRCISPDGQWVASVSREESHRILVVPILNGGEPIELTGEAQQTYLPVSFSQSGDRLLTLLLNRTDGSVKLNVWDVKSREGLYEVMFAGSGKPPAGNSLPGLPAVLSLDGKQLACRGGDGLLVVHDVDAGTESQRFPDFVPSKHILSVMAFSPDGRQLAASAVDGGIWIHDVSTGAREAVLRGHAGVVYGLSFSPGGRRLISGGADMSVRVWDVASMRQLQILRGHTAGQDYGVLGVAFSPDGRGVASGGWDTTIKVWDVSSDKPVPAESEDKNTLVATESSIDRGTSAEFVTIDVHSGGIESLCVSPDGMHVASGSLDGTVQIVDLNTNERVVSFSGHNSSVGAVAYSPDGRLVASGSGGKGATQGGQILLWNSADGKLVHTLDGHKRPISALQFTPDGNRLVSGSGSLATMDQPGEMKVWSVSSGKELKSFPDVKSPIAALAISPDGTTLASGHYEYNSGIQLWNLESGQPRHSLGNSILGFWGMEFSPDGKRLAVGGSDWTVSVWDLVRKKELWSEKKHGGAVYDMTFSPNGHRLISASIDSTMRVWNPVNGDELLTLKESGPLYEADFSSDGRFLLSAGPDGKIRIRDSAREAIEQTDQWPIILADDFEREELGARWTVRLGDCLIEKGVLKCVVEEHPTLELGMTFAQLQLDDQPLPSTVDVSFDFWTPHKLNCAVNFHDETISFGVAGMFMGTGHVIWNSGETGASVLVFGGGVPREVNTNGRFILEPDRRYRFRILREPTSVRLFADGEEIVSSRVPRLPGLVLILQALLGKPGDVAYFDNLEIRAPESTAAELKAIELVKSLYDDLPVKSVVIDRIQNDKSLTDAARKQALEIAAFRKPEEPADAVDLIWKRLVSGNAGPGISQSFLRYAEELAQSAPETRGIQRLLAIAQLRSGDAQAALGTLAKAERRYREEFGHADAATASLLAITHHQLQHLPDARSYVEQVDDLMRSQFFAGDADARQLAEQARKLVSAPDDLADADLTAIRDITFLPQQALATGHDLDAWRKQWAEGARIVRGREEKPGPYDVVRTLEQEIGFQKLDSRTPPPIGARLVRDEIQIEIKDNLAQVRQETVSGGVRPSPKGSSLRSSDRRGYLLKLTKSPSGWAITERRGWPIQSNDGNKITEYNERLWADQDASVTEARKSSDPRSLQKALWNAGRFKEAFQIKREESLGKDAKYWAQQVYLVRQLEDVQHLQNAVNRLLEIDPAVPPFVRILRDVSARKNLSEKPTSFNRNVRLRLPHYVTMHEPSDLALPGEVCGAWETAKGSVEGIYVTEFEELQTVDGLLADSDIDDFFSGMGATILSKQTQQAGEFPSASYLTEGMGHGVALDGDGPILTRGRWVFVPQGKQVYCFLFVSPAYQADALNAEFEVILQTLSFGKDNP
jgi:WD40 repeat protein